MEEQSYNKLFTFRNSIINPEYCDGLRAVPLRPCLINNNSEYSEESHLRIQTEPKWLTTLNVHDVDVATGEIIHNVDTYETNSLRQATGRKIKKVDAFCDAYQDLYRKKDVSLLFHTFTRYNYSNFAGLGFAPMLDNVKYHYRQIERPLRGYIWVLECSEDLHVHYHLAVAIDRLNVTQIPSYLKFEGAWGQITGVEFVKRNVRHYLSKYISKQNAKVEGLRSYGSSLKFI